MALGDLFELVIEATMLAQAVRNVFHYVQSEETVGTGVINSKELSDSFEDNVLDWIIGALTNDVFIQNISVRNLFDPDDANVSPIGVAGNVVTNVAGTTNDSVSAFAAYPISIEVAGGALRGGAKRFAGVTKSVVVDGVVVDAGMLSQLDNLAGALVPTLYGGGLAGGAWRPIIVRRIRSGTPGNYTYRLPENVSEGVYALVSDAIPSAVISTQNSRKLGRGA